MPRTRSSATPGRAPTPAPTSAPGPAPGVSPALSPISSASPLPPPHPRRDTAVRVTPSTPLGRLPCFTAILGAPPTLDVTRVFTPDNMSCGEGSRLELILRLQPILMKFEPIPGSENFLKVCEEAEEKAHSTRGVGSASFRRNEAKAMVAHVVDLLRYHGVLLVSENCVLLHGAVEVEADPTAPPPMAAAAAPEKGPAQKEKGQAAGSGGLSGGEAASNSSTPEPVEDDGSQDDRDLVHLVTAQSHGSEVCPIFTSYSYSSRGEAGLPDTIFLSWFTGN